MAACSYVQDNIDEIHAIINKARAKRGRHIKLKARPVEEREEGEGIDHAISKTKEEEAFAMTPQAPAHKTSRQKWLADTGASAYMTD